MNSTVDNYLLEFNCRGLPLALGVLVKFGMTFMNNVKIIFASVFLH